MDWKLEHGAANETALGFEAWSASLDRQIRRHILLVAITSSALAYTILGAQIHEYLEIAATMVIIFWMGLALSFIGMVLERAGDLWSGPAAIAESLGLGTTVIASFTGLYYGALFTLTHAPPGFVWWHW